MLSLRIFHFNNVGTDPVTAAVAFAGNLFRYGQHSFCSSEIDYDISSFIALDNAVYDFAFAVLEFLINKIPFSSLHLLNDDLSC